MEAQEDTPISVPKSKPGTRFKASNAKRGIGPIIRSSKPSIGPSIGKCTALLESVGRCGYHGMDSEQLDG